MKTLLETWRIHEIELNELMARYGIRGSVEHNLRLMQIKHQREELRAMQNDK